MNKSYLTSIIKHYENCLDRYGDSHQGVDWPKANDVGVRYDVMLELISFHPTKSDTAQLLDFGCGAAHLLEHIKRNGIENIDYSGLDLSEKFINLCTNKFPGTRFYCLDILEKNVVLPQFDYIVMNGVFTEKRDLSFDEMWDYVKRMLVKVFAFAKKGIAFNAMSKAVEWERDDLFHLPADLLIDFITTHLTRNFIIRNDYGLFEFTTYVYQ